MELNVCILGCGDRGKTHASDWAARKDARVVAVYDPKTDRAKQLAERMSAQGALTVVCDDYKKAICHEGVNVVSICSPTVFHPEQACFAMEHGRHVLCEKPIALTLKEADRMIAEAKKRGVFLTLCFQYRGFPISRKCKELYEAGAFGGPIHLITTSAAEVRPKTEMNRRSFNGGPVIDLICHKVDLVRFITGCEPVSVYAAGNIFGKGKKRTAPHEDDLAIDAAAVTVKYSGGHILSQYVNWGMPEGFKGFFPGSETVIGPALCVKNGPDGVEAQFADRKVVYNRGGNEAFGAMVRIADLINAINKKAPLEVSGENGRIALAVSLAALESIETGKAVEL